MPMPAKQINFALVYSPLKSDPSFATNYSFQKFPKYNPVMVESIDEAISTSFSGSNILKSKLATLNHHIDDEFRNNDAAVPCATFKLSNSSSSSSVSTSVPQLQRCKSSSCPLAFEEEDEFESIFACISPKAHNGNLLDPCFGQVQNMYSSLDATLIGKCLCSFDKQLAPVILENGCSRRGRPSLRPTRIPTLMTRSVSATGRNTSTVTDASFSRSFSAGVNANTAVKIDGSCERLADDLEETPFNVSKSLLKRCAKRKLPPVPSYTKRCLVAPLTRRPRETLCCRNFSQTRGIHPDSSFSSIRRFSANWILAAEHRSPHIMSNSCFGSYGIQEFDLPIQQQEPILNRLQTRYGTQGIQLSTSTSRSSSPYKQPQSIGVSRLLPRRNRTPLLWDSLWCEGLNSSDSGVSDGSLDDYCNNSTNSSFPTNQSDYKRSKRMPVERMVALWRCLSARCALCRNDQRLRRLDRTRRMPRVGKSKVARRDKCVCKTTKVSIVNIKVLQPTGKSVARQLNIAFLVAAFALFLRIIEVLFLDSH